MLVVFEEPLRIYLRNAQYNIPLRAVGGWVEVVGGAFYSRCTVQKYVSTREA